MTTTAPATTADSAAAFTGRVLADSAAVAAVMLAALGDRLGLFAALTADGPATSGELAARTRTDERYVREWAAGLVAAGYLDRDPVDGRIALPAAHVPTLAQEGGTTFFGGVHQELVGLVQGFYDVADAFRTGGGVAPEDLVRPCPPGRDGQPVQQPLRAVAGRLSHRVAPHEHAQAVRSPRRPSSDPPSRG